MISYFAIAIQKNGQTKVTDTVIPEIKNFPDGTYMISAPDIDEKMLVKGIQLSWKYENEAELPVLIYLTENLKDRYPHLRLRLYMPYLPNARMDRTYKPSEVFTLKYFCSVINSLGFDKVSVLDVHSNVGVALLDRCESISPNKYIAQMLLECGFDPDRDYLFFPDEGSCKRYSGLQAITECKNIGFGIKKRDWDTGKILGLNAVGPDPKGKRVFIIDDICAYGGTVYYSAEKLKELSCEDINVFFTHCENSIAKGKLFSCGMIKGIYTTNSLCSLNEEEYPLLHIYDCFE